MQESVSPGEIGGQRRVLHIRDAETESSQHAPSDIVPILFQPTRSIYCALSEFDSLAYSPRPRRGKAGP
jgi:hypothetical protein